MPCAGVSIEAMLLELGIFCMKLLGTGIEATVSATV